VGESSIILYPRGTAITAGFSEVNEDMIKMKWRKREAQPERPSSDTSP
jgi:hypothetical protein